MYVFIEFQEVFLSEGCGPWASCSIKQCYSIVNQSSIVPYFWSVVSYSSFLLWRLPLRNQRLRLPNNRAMALDRANRFDAYLRRDPLKRKHFLDFTQKQFNNKHVEIAPPVEKDKKVWYLKLEKLISCI